MTPATPAPPSLRRTQSKSLPDMGADTNKAKAAVLMLTAVSLFACLDSSAKIASRELPAFEVVWVRFALHFLFAGIALNPWRTPEAWRTNNPKLQVIRALIQIVCTVLNFLALGYLQIAQTLSIQFTGPAFVTLLSIFWLGEKVGRYRWTAIGISFIGVLVITRPAPGSINPAFGIILASVIVGSAYSIITRRLTSSDSPGSMLLIMAALPALILTPLMPFIWIWPRNAATWIGLAGAGFFGALSHYFYIQAHRHAPASFLAPLAYFQFLAVLVLGFVFFGDIPTVWTLIGSMILMGSGLYIWHRERVLAKTTCEN
ncbi:DMT family transporter [Rhizobium oryzicola]|uniref:DMT family transporter n=1 Tax=Rhizobium oryzicola TaxID=1232668 RepID=A0ABT8T2R3_9HYPH|nr:DMT family transporter [Rhizobium oryzicola]MDO1585044.1 DMT family transporter [Rhizobium oryzicola]